MEVPYSVFGKGACVWAAFFRFGEMKWKKAHRFDSSFSCPSEKRTLLTDLFYQKNERALSPLCSYRMRSELRSRARFL